MIFERKDPANIAWSTPGGLGLTHNAAQEITPAMKSYQRW
jgi:hypothetical protein